MTNERAIELLRRISDAQFDGPHGDERREALEMAVRAMSEETMSKALEALKDIIKAQEEREKNTTTWLGSYSPYTCEHCGYHVDSKTPYCAYCGRRATNYEN